MTVHSRRHIWIHVDENGREHRFDDQHEFLPCKLVTICDDGSEETLTRDGMWPPGDGWEYQGWDDDGHSIWRRRRP